jgi:hypothetical protein
MKNKKTVALMVCFILFLIACKNKEKKAINNFVRPHSTINDQLKDIDTALYTIIKINYRDTAHSDTEYIRREDIRLVAKDFLDLPELSPEKYTEETIPGPTGNLSTLSYKPIQPGKEDVQRLDIIIDPDMADIGKNVIKSIYIDRGFSNKDSSMQKRMLWQVDKSFQVNTIRQLPGQPEINTTYKVIWNDEENP